MSRKKLSGRNIRINLELLPCPFCGYAHSSLREGEKKPAPGRLMGPLVYWVVCRNCLARSQFYKDEKKAIESWNRRELEWKEKAA